MVRSLAGMRTRRIDAGSITLPCSGNSAISCGSEGGSSRILSTPHGCCSLPLPALNYRTATIVATFQW